MSSSLRTIAISCSLLAVVALAGCTSDPADGWETSEPATGAEASDPENGTDESGGELDADGEAVGTAESAVCRWALTKNCGPGKSVVLHWRTRTSAFCPVWGIRRYCTVPEDDGYDFSSQRAGTHSRNTGAPSYSWRFINGNTNAYQSWGTCSNAI